MDPVLLFTIIGVAVAGTAAVVGIWMERDPRRPPRWAYALSGLIVAATLVSVFQSWLDAQAAEKLEDQMAEMLITINEMASRSDDPEVQQMAKLAFSTQASTNPDVVQKLAQQVTDDGGDPTEVLASHLPASKVKGLARGGKLKTAKLSKEEKKKLKKKREKKKREKEKRKKEKEKKKKQKEKEKKKKEREQKKKEKEQAAAEGGEVPMPDDEGDDDKKKKKKKKKDKEKKKKKKNKKNNSF